MRLRNADSKGFSLIELMIAMTVTLIVSGAIYGLMTGGQNAFRREPAMTDRQQNIRLAMDIIMRDIASAGTGMPPFIQTLTPGLDSCADCPAAPGGDAATPGGPNTDDLEIMANPWGLGAEEACKYPGGHSATVFLVAGTTNLQDDGLIVMVLLQNGRWTMRETTGTSGVSNAGGDACKSNEPHAHVLINPGQDETEYNVPDGICGGDQVTVNGECVGCTYKGDIVPGNSCCSATGDCIVDKVLQGEVIRYRVRPDATGVPNLERWSSGSIANFAAGVPQFQVIARGIDDMQVEYFDANGVRYDSAPLVDQSQIAYGSLIRSVRVTLSARSEAQNVAGTKTVAVGPAALRGQLTSIGTPRAVLDTLGTRVTQRESGWSGPTWY